MHLKNSMEHFHAACILWDHEQITTEDLLNVAVDVDLPQQSEVLTHLIYMDDGPYPFEEV